MMIPIPEPSLVVLMGASGSGKSHFAGRHFRPTEVLSSDSFRAWVCDDPNDQEATADAFETLHFVAAKRLERRRLCVIDATHVRSEDRRKLLDLARRYHLFAVALVFDLPRRVCEARNRARTDCQLPAHLVRNQLSRFRRSVKALKREGFRYVYKLRSEEEVDAVQIERSRLWTDRADDEGPFDIVGDIHGCCDELEELLSQLGYRSDAGVWSHPEGRRALFLGDLVDRGPRILDTVQLVRVMVEAGQALCLPGNHEVKFVKALRGRQVKLRHGLEHSMAEVEALPAADKEARVARIISFIDGLVSHFVLDQGRLVVAHAGMKEALQGRASGRVRSFALYGETTGESDEFGLPVRYPWAEEYRGKAAVVYGHTPTPEAEWLNNTICLDTGCVFGGQLTALRWPERELVSVPAREVYCEAVRPLEAGPDARSAQQHADTLLDLQDVTGKRQIKTRLRGMVTVREEGSAAALEVLSRFAIDPRWLIYLPPTMAPCGTSQEPGTLEHPREALAYYRKLGIEQVICEEKHMGSRAVVVVCRDAESARERFAVSEGLGAIYTRTGRAFFPDKELETRLLTTLQAAAEAAGLFEQLQSDWLCLDCELLPWSAKAGALLRQQYAPVAKAAELAVAAELTALEQASKAGREVGALRARCEARQRRVLAYAQAYQAYCWDVEQLAGIKLAPFHLLASEGAVHADRTHTWHLELLGQLREPMPSLFQPTRTLLVELADEASCQACFAWWEGLTAEGGEGMVVKPAAFTARGTQGLVQPAVKCRGREYLRIIYGPEYDAEVNLVRLRKRGLSRKRSLALREFALGIEGLERFVGREPLRRVHECAFAVLALESEPVDPRL